MLAIINAIKHYDTHTSINIISDSGYVVKGYNHPAYLDRWIQNNWRTSTKSPVLNRDLWEIILSLTYTYGVKFNLIRGHYKDNNPVHAYWNAIVDRACTWIMHNHRVEELVVLRYTMADKSLTLINREVL